MVGQMKSRLSDAIEAIREHYAETPISFAEFAAFRRGLASDGWRSYQPLLIALGEKVHGRLSAMLHDPLLAPRVLDVLMRSGGQSGVRAALGHAPHLIPHLLEGEPRWQELAIEGLPEGLARRAQADEDAPGGVLAYLCDFARHLALHPDKAGLRDQLAQALEGYKAGPFPEVAAWKTLSEILSTSDPGLASLAQARGEAAYRDLLVAYADRAPELPTHYLGELQLCADHRALPLLDSLVAHNSAQGTWDDEGTLQEPRWTVPFPGAEELRERLLASALEQTSAPQRQSNPKSQRAATRAAGKAKKTAGRSR